MSTVQSGGGAASLSASETDVIVLGVGTCGEDLSLRLLGAGLSVVGIEAALVGGECAYWACLPSKLMIRAANVLQEARRVDGMAGNATVVPDWPLVARRVRNEVTGGWDDSYAVQRFQSRGGLLVHGRGRLTGHDTVAVGDQTFTARRAIVLATGSRPVIPPIPGLDQVLYWTTHDVIQAETLPDSLIVLGGGAVGCELGQVLSRFGVQVTIVEAAERLMPSEEPEASEVIQAALSAEGIDVRTGAAVSGVEARNSGVVLTLENGGQISGQRLLVATGRLPNTKHIGLAAIGFDPAPRAIPVNDRMQIDPAVRGSSSAVALYAMGDVTGKAMLTHVALYQSAIVVAGILGLEHPPARYDAVPRAAFTDPELGAVGLTEAQARDGGRDVIAVVKQLPATFRGWLHGSGNGIIKLVADRDSGVLLGATAVGPRAGDMLGMLNLAVHARVPLAELRSMIYAFPTFYGAIGEAIGAYGRGLATVIDPGYEGFQTLDAAGASMPTIPNLPSQPAAMEE